MSRLPDPLRSGLDGPADAASVERVWRAIEARRRGTPLEHATKFRRAWLPRAVAAMVLLAVGVAGASAWRSTSRRPVRVATPGARLTTVVAGALRLADGRAIEPGFFAVGPVLLSDGSRIEVGEDTALEALASDDRALVTRLARGRARYEVTPGGPRRWTVECGPISVEVVGTIFELERSRTALRVAVERGVVLVRGEGVTDRVRRLSAGESLLVRLATDEAVSPPRASSPHTASSVPAAAPAFARRPVDARPGNAPARPAHAVATRSHEPLTAEPSSAPPVPSATAGSSVDPVDLLFTQADEARRGARALEAAALLGRIVDEHARDDRAALAAFTLGRLEADTLHRPSRAAAAFERALSLGLPTELRDDARARLTQLRAAPGTASHVPTR